MANEYTVSCSLAVAKGGAAINSVGTGAAASKNHDMSGADMGMATQAVGTSYEAIEIAPDISPIGICFISNLDSTNFLLVSFDGGTTDHLKVRPLHRALFQPASGVSIQVKFDTLAGSIAVGAAEE